MHYKASIFHGAKDHSKLFSKNRHEYYRFIGYIGVSGTRVKLLKYYLDPSRQREGDRSKIPNCSGVPFNNLFRVM